MIKKYNQYIKESLLDKITGPTEEELIKNLDTMDLNKAVRRSVEYGLNDVAKKLAYKFKAKLIKDENYYLDAPIYTDSKDFIEALCIACVQNNLDMVKFYIEYIGVNFHYEDEAAMRHATANGNIEIVKYLLSKGADPSVNNNRPLRIANENGKFEIYELMLGYINNNESLLNKIEGPTLNQIKHDLFMNVENGMLSIEYFLKQCEIHNIERPSNDFIGKIIENEFNINKITFVEYILKCKKFNIKPKYNNEEIENFLKQDDIKLFNRIKGLLDNRVKEGKYLYTIKVPIGRMDGFYMNDNDIIVEYDFWDLISSEFIKYTKVKLIEYITVMINLYVDENKNVIITTKNPQQYNSNDYY